MGDLYAPSFFFFVLHRLFEAYSKRASFFFDARAAEVLMMLLGRMDSEVALAHQKLGSTP